MCAVCTYLFRCVLLLLHPGTLGDDELMAALVDDASAHWKHSIKTRRSGTLLNLSELNLAFAHKM